MTTAASAIVASPSANPPPIPRRILGRSGIAAGEIGIGCWAIGGPDWNLGIEMGWGPSDPNEVRRGIDAAVDLGANHFDTADVYGHGASERLLGEALSGHDRSGLVIASKLGYFAGTAANAYDPVHMRHQLETSLRNLRTTYLDIYYLHNFNFGADDGYLDGAIEAMHRFKDRGLVRAIGMRGPHRYAPERLNGRRDGPDKYQRFISVADRLKPDVVQVRYNMLSPHLDAEERDIFAWTAARQIGVVINKPLAQGLLLDKYDPQTPPSFAAGDHRNKKSWFKADGLRLLRRRLAPIRERFGGDTQDLVRVALQYCLARAPHAVVLAGFRDERQVRMNLAAAGHPLSDADLAFVRTAMADITEEIGDYFSRPGGAHGR